MPTGSQLDASRPALESRRPLIGRGGILRKERSGCLPRLPWLSAPDRKRRT